MRNFDWAASPVGSPETWPQALQTAIGLLLGAKQPVYVAWGPELTSFYNDGYLPIVGKKHPSLGLPFSELFAEIWGDFKPIVDATMAGNSQHFVDLPIALAGRPGLPVGYFTFSYTALRDASGTPMGFYCAATETTQQVLADQQSKREHDQLTRMLSQAPSFMALLEGPEHRFVLMNNSYLQLVGHRDLVGLTVREALPEVAGQGYIALLDGVFMNAEPFVGRGMELDLQREKDAPLERVFLNFVYQPIVDASGAVTGIFVEGTDVTDLKRTEIALRESELRGRLALDAGAIGVWESTIDGNSFANLVGDTLALKLLGGTPGEPADFRTFLERIHPADVEAVKLASAEVINPESDGILDVEYRLIGAENAPERWVHVRAQRTIRENSTRLIGTVRDISDRREADRQLKLLNDEMRHRIKNTLAIVSAISTQTLKGDDIAGRKAVFNSRLETLSRAHDLLDSSSWAGASVRAVLERTLAAHGGTDHRFRLTGPDIDLSTKQALSLSLAVHELATNATKYGALSVDSGLVSIDWNAAQTSDSAAAFTFQWTESGGPPVVAPTTKGFGSRLVTRVLPEDFGGTVSIRYLPSGVVCLLTAPWSH